MSILRVLLTPLSLARKSFRDTLENCTADKYDYSGSWVTQECNALIALDGTVTNSWLKGVYNFTENGVIKFDSVPFDNSSRLGDSIKTQHDLTPEISYDVIAPLATDDGSEGTEIEITVEIEGKLYKTPGYLVITTENELCYSSTFYFGPDHFSFSQSALTGNILYENYLVKGKLPWQFRRHSSILRLDKTLC